jgi:hypothetical protein
MRLAAAALLATLAVAGCRAQPPAPTLGIRSLCFAPPALALPDDATRARVEGLTRGLEGPSARWIRALMTHESGGDVAAISPTGCAGPLAIAACRGCTPCCVADDGDGSDRIYDRCRSEERHGFLCDRSLDPRFRPAFALAIARQKLAALEGRLAGAPAGSFAYPVALAASWNAGPGVFADFPAGLRSAESAVERLDFAASRSYAGWSERDRWNKVVEVYDYALWLALLGELWRDPATAAPPPPAGERCFDVDGGRFTAAARRAGDYRRIAVVRLRFGRYLPGEIEVLETSP